jgi:hypothetical protein
MSEIVEYLKRAAKRTGLKRESYIEKKIPTEPSNIIAIPFFGDPRSVFILSSLVLKNYKDSNPDKYVILCSWPGYQAFFPYVDEYWTIEDESLIKSLAISANNIYNDSTVAAELTKNLAEVLNILTAKDLIKFYNNGFTKKYWEDFREIRRFMPEVPSSTLISKDFKTQLNNRTGKKIVVYPSSKMKSWQRGNVVSLPISKEFWSKLINRLFEEGYDPIIYQNWFTYDMSQEFVDRCMYLTPHTASDLLAALRQIGFVLDVHTGISRFAIAARCPYLAVTERHIYIDSCDYEIDDLCAADLPRQYIFSFSTQLMTGDINDWELSVLSNIMIRLKEFFPKIDNKKLPSTVGSYETVSYSNVRQRKAKRLGTTFIRTSKVK